MELQGDHRERRDRVAWGRRRGGRFCRRLVGGRDLGSRNDDQSGKQRGHYARLSHVFDTRVLCNVGANRSGGFVPRRGSRNRRLSVASHCRIFVR